MNADSIIELALCVWFALTAVSLIYVTYDLIARTPEMKVMKWGWILVVLYTGPVALVIYWFSCREPTQGSHEKFIAPLWKQSVGSTIHCLAGDATGIIVAAAITSVLGLPMGMDAVVEYAAGFSFGLFVFQALFMKDMLGGTYWQAVRATWLAEWLSMNAVMAGMVPVMIVLMTRDMQAMEPINPRFWGIMSLATLVGAALAFPINWWLVKEGLKHGMGTERALGRGGSMVEAERERLAATAPTEPVLSSRRAQEALRADHGMSGMGEATEKGSAATLQAHTAATHQPRGDAPAMDGRKMRGDVSIKSKIAMTILTLLILAAGVILAARYGDLSMRAGKHTMIEPMEMPAGHDGMTK